MRDYNYDLMASCVDGNLQGVKDSLTHGAAINSTDQLWTHTPLMFALKNNKQHIVDYLLSQGADTTPVTRWVFCTRVSSTKTISTSKANL